MDFNKIQHKWRDRWESDKTFRVEADKREKYYIAFVYPYMSGLLHLGHLFTYTNSEVLMRYKRMQGKNVLAKFGFHCTGTPIVAAAKRVAEGETSQIETLKRMGITQKEIPKFSDPIHWIDYFPQETLKDLKNIGFSIDDRYCFRTTDKNPSYNAFIRWQFNKLKDAGYVKKGKHPVVWCPKDKEPTGDHARSEGEGETPQEYMLFKHKLADGRFLLSATLRQDTVLGITNLFIHPEMEYVQADVNGEIWIIGKAAATRLAEQDYKVKITGKVKGTEFIGKEVEEFGERKVIILPATFLKADFGTGLVHSVPSESADDLIALRDLQKDSARCKKYGLDFEKVKAIKPIPVLNTPEFGEMGAVFMLDKYKIKSQDQRDKLDKIKKELYKVTHHTATMNSLYKKAFSVNLEGKKVDVAKDVIKKELIEGGWALKYYELTGKVVCRCLTECTVKVVSNQWFIQYNDLEWKKKAHKALDGMTIYPDKLRKQFDYVIDWLDKWACTRELGLGTKLPWDENWLIESLSDSTIQMAYGTISKYLEHPSEYGFKTNHLNDELFDYVYLNKGSVEAVEKSTGISKKIIETMKNDFNYWYPFDFRNSAKDLIQNHLTFSIFNHTAIFPEKHWPKAFLINGRIMVNGEKMSKSKGNFFTVRELYEKHGADPVRLTAIYAGEGAEDANYDMNFLEISKRKLSELYEFISLHNGKGRKEREMIDDWFESKINESIKNTTEAMENMMFKSAVQFSFLDMQRHLKWYMRRTKTPNKDLISQFISALVRMMAPMTPHFCEECWELIGGTGLVSLADWPSYNASRINPLLDNKEEFIRQIYSDMRTVKGLAKLDNIIQAKVIISPEWKYEFFKLMKEQLEQTRDPKQIIGAVMQTELKRYGKDIMKIVPFLIKDASKLPKTILNQKEELDIVNSELKSLKKEFSCKFDVEIAENSKEGKARNASPGKPAIILN